MPTVSQTVKINVDLHERNRLQKIEKRRKIGLCRVMNTTS